MINKEYLCKTQRRGLSETLWAALGVSREGVNKEGYIGSSWDFSLCALCSKIDIFPFAICALVTLGKTFISSSFV